MKLIPGQPALDLVLAAKDDGQTAAGLLQKVLGEIELRVGKEGRTRHLLAIDEAPLALVADKSTKIPDQAPERLAIVDRPAMEFCIAGESFS